MKDLPADVLYLVCEELANRQDFGTLFNCAMSSKSLAIPALLWMYRYDLETFLTGGHSLTCSRAHDQCSIRSSEGNDADFDKNGTCDEAVAKQIYSKWALQWKSIIRSSMGHTAYPYCLYIRSLDLRNLTELLEDQLFREISQTFFADDMAQFLKKPDTPIKQKMRGAKTSNKMMNVPDILDLVGESITKFVSQSANQNRATVALEDLSGNISGAALPRWVGRISKLKGMTLWDGAALGGSVATSIANNCHHFDELTFYRCLKTDIDQDLASFFSGLKKNSLRSFAALSANAIGPETLLSLNHHKSSLQRLKLDGLRSEAIKALSCFQECIALEALEIQDSDGLVNLEAAENDIFLEVIAWLGRCEGLRELLLRNFASGPAILTQICLKNNIRLRKLQVVGYPLLGNQDFHKALSHQNSLESLELRADPEGAFRDDIDILVSSISHLNELKYLNLVATSDYFHTSEILNLSSVLLNLEELWFGGYDVTDDLWHGMANLHQLRSLNISAVTSFSFEGILAYISILKDTNRGLLLSVMSQKAENPLSDYEETVIRQSIADKVNGKFDFTLFREVDSESEAFSD
jgi:hypothetical protein